MQLRELLPVLPGEPVRHSEHGLPAALDILSAPVIERVLRLPGQRELPLVRVGDHAEMVNRLGGTFSAETGRLTAVLDRLGPPHRAGLSEHVLRRVLVRRERLRATLESLHVGTPGKLAQPAGTAIRALHGLAPVAVQVLVQLLAQAPANVLDDLPVRPPVDLAGVLESPLIGPLPDHTRGA